MKFATTKIFIFLVYFWIALSVFNVFYNTVKTVFEIKEWSLLSNSEERYKIFGDKYSFSVFIDDNTEEKAHILLIIEDTMILYLTKYFLYPKIVKMTDDEVYQYIAVFNKKIDISNYKLIASFSGKTSSDFGYLYQRK